MPVLLPHKGATGVENTLRRRMKSNSNQQTAKAIGVPLLLFLLGTVLAALAGQFPPASQ